MNRKILTKRLPILFLLMSSIFTNSLSAQTIYPRKEYAAVLQELCNALLTKQISTVSDKNFGAIACEHCHVLHTRASETVYPFAVEYIITKDAKYLRAAINTGNWLISQQEKNGSWKETPEEWTGTSTDQLLMMLLSYEIVSPHLTAAEKQKWLLSMRGAADYLNAVMTPEFASINYVATTTASLAKASLLLNVPAYMQTAKSLAHRTIAKMDEDGFVNGEGGRSHKNKSGVDLGYAMEMSLWGLGYYARLSGDELVNSYVKKSLKTHLYFIYPDGSMDASWGIRSNKWTTYGGVTSDGCQALFALYANEDPRYISASLKNLAYLKTNMKDGIVGYGPQQWEIFTMAPCIYPTFTKAKNIAFAYSMDTANSRTYAAIPTEKTGWLKLFSTIDVAEVRTKNFMSTITSYGYKDYVAGSKSKYMYRPAGGAISNLWLKDHGFLFASSPTVYSRPELMTFPEAEGVKCLTARIEYTDSLGYFTNLFDFDSKLRIENKNGPVYKINIAGDLKDKNWLAGGVGYRMQYSFSDNELRKTITLVYKDTRPVIRIVEPFINYKGMQFKKIDDATVMITAGSKKIRFKILSGNATLVMGENEDHYWTPFPALKAYPIDLLIKPGKENIEQSVSYAITILN
jgi:hypothetical protein